MKKHFILILITVLTLASCKKYESQYGTETAATSVLKADVYEIAYSTESGVFLINAAMDRSKMLVSFANNASPKAGPVALSAKRDKVAYVDPDNGIPIIMDTLGNVLAQLTQYPNTKDLGWYNGEATLYILSNNQVHFYGEALDLPSPLFVVPPYANDYEVTALDINEDLDVVYGAVYYKLSSMGRDRDWYYSSTINYKSPSVTDETTVVPDATYASSQNILTDSRHYYHTVQFTGSYYSVGVQRVVVATALETPLATEFKGYYTFFENNIELSITENGRLSRYIEDRYQAEYIFTSASASWTINIPAFAPLYVDWATDF
ncbi:MAG: Unknown protein [uncultured Aureispira sp.]|uniref:Uncharacterized protein n=1 Tax=uncultured Aureispira sp. TaxID=1331704 RepID=A0A6S6UFH8_9BACT|nr:MAG: Unknown protein [uncultured Aureispira sp.]